ncbi:Glutamine--fructose-6-phosphate aminotransferase [isomerizing] (EC 2.6.1.16), partial [Methylomonas albis]
GWRFAYPPYGPGGKQRRKRANRQNAQRCQHHLAYRLHRPVAIAVL